MGRYQEKGSEDGDASELVESGSEAGYWLCKEVKRSFWIGGISLD